MVSIRMVHKLHSQFEIWTVDTEFGSVKGVHAIPWSVVVQNARTDEVVVSTPVDDDHMKLEYLSHHVSTWR